MFGNDLKKPYIKPQLISHGSVEDLTNEEDEHSGDSPGGTIES
jgi:hypothetical protein